MSIDTFLTITNVILTSISAVGAWKSSIYFKRSKNIAILAQTNNTLLEIQKMLNKAPEILTAYNMAMHEKRGFSLQNTLHNIGIELDNSLNEIRKNIPVDYSKKIRSYTQSSKF